MKHWLVLWKTWTEDEIETPWDFVLVDKTNDFRLRSNPALSVSSEIVNDIYLSFDPEKIDKFLAEYVEAYVLSAVIAANTDVEVEQEIKRFFKDAELVKVVEVPDQYLQEVLEELQK